MSDEPDGGAPPSRVLRVESVWREEFGNSYAQRNRAAGEGREPFWRMALSQCPAHRVLEVGCNLGGNLQWIAGMMEPRGVFGVDINEEALSEVRQRLPGINAVWATARELPFRDRYFDLVFTTGVLIHQPPDILPVVMNEIVRCSRRFVICGEYFSASPVAVPYRDQEGIMWKRDFGGYYQELFPELALRSSGFLPGGVNCGWDDITYWIFEKGS